MKLFVDSCLENSLRILINKPKEKQKTAIVCVEIQASRSHDDSHCGMKILTQRSRKLKKQEQELCRMNKKIKWRKNMSQPPLPDGLSATRAPETKFFNPRNR